MTPKKFKEIVGQYQHLLRFVRGEQARGEVAPREGKPIRHARWMVDELAKMAGEKVTGKANRWLGFVQGILWTQGIFTIDQMREHNRKERSSS